ncbi:HmuY family protein [Tunicatimonas pelagia]|uniref:HmuY family protein n=1 Tax=Tunicatimonas pelagia TaxID=931531 RepID=UPI002666C696|nr:HmuY family protein [Tunicatimonas pelagia]WKN43024.1 HmuY family protein [Tunicatimonas pelagia]
MRSVHSLFYFGLLSTLLVFAGCEEDEEAAPPAEVETVLIEDLETGTRRRGRDTTYFDLESGQIVPDDQANTTEWDIAFDNTDILVNSGISGSGQVEAQIVEGVFESIGSAPENGYRTDADSALAIPAGPEFENSWYRYTAETRPARAVLPIPGRVIVLRTNEGNFAKLEIISWYKGNPDTSTDEFADNIPARGSGHFTFQYALRPGGSREF